MKEDRIKKFESRNITLEKEIDKKIKEFKYNLEAIKNLKIKLGLSLSYTELHPITKWDDPN